MRKQHNDKYDFPEFDEFSYKDFALEGFGYEDEFEDRLARYGKYDRHEKSREAKGSKQRREQLEARFTRMRDSMFGDDCEEDAEDENW